MKKLIITTLLSASFVFASDINTTSTDIYPKDWTAEDIAFYDTKTKEWSWLDIDDSITECDNGFYHLPYNVCLMLKSVKQINAYYDANNEQKRKQAANEFCYYLLRSGENDKQILINHAFGVYSKNGEDFAPLALPSELKKFEKECAKKK